MFKVGVEGLGFGEFVNLLVFGLIMNVMVVGNDVFVVFMEVVIVVNIKLVEVVGMVNEVFGLVCDKLVEF